MEDKYIYNSKGRATSNVEELKAELLRHTRKRRHLERLLKVIGFDIIKVLCLFCQCRPEQIGKIIFILRDSRWRQRGVW